MAWFKLDDKFHMNRKIARVPLPAIGLWTLCASWSMDELSDGFVPDFIAARFSPQYRRHAKVLVDAELWVESSNDGDKGWQFHDWDKYQLTRNELETRREQARERMAKARESSPNVRANKARTSQEPATTPYPYPVVPKGTTHTQAESAFESFYAAYPRKAKKADAAKAFKQAVKSKPANEIIEAARKLANDPNLPEKQFIPYPATWLRAGGWDDDPYPPRHSGGYRNSNQIMLDELERAHRATEAAPVHHQIEGCF